MRILLVEDESEMANVLRSALARHSIVVDHAPSLEIAREASLSHTHDAVLLDRKLPDGEGLSLIPELRRQNPALPIIVLSALGSLDNRVIGLDEGADDYLAKPFSIDELMARLRAVLRRPAQMRSETLMIGALEFEPEHNAVRINGQPVDLPLRRSSGGPGAPSRAIPSSRRSMALTTTSPPMPSTPIFRVCAASSPPLGSRSTPFAASAICSGKHNDPGALELAAIQAYAQAGVFPDPGADGVCFDRIGAHLQVCLGRRAR